VNPATTKRSTGVYGAPRGLEDQVGGLPYWRTYDERVHTTVIWSEWQPDEYELAVLNAGGRVLVGIVGEPIHPMSVGVQARDEERKEDQQLEQEKAPETEPTTPTEPTDAAPSEPKDDADKEPA